MGEKCIIFSFIVMLLTYILCLGLMIFIIVLRYRDSRKFEYVWISSEIKTIKNIVKINTYDKKPFNSISPQGIISTLSITYYDLLKLISKSGCKKGYRQCGILDTFKNKLCIDNKYPCPINDLVADLTSKKNEYTKKGYDAIYLKKMTYNYNLYFSNNSILGNSSISMIKTFHKPTYINYDNFILDSDAFEETFGSLKLSQKGKNILSTNNNQTNNEIIEFFNDNGRRLEEKDFKATIDLVSSVMSTMTSGFKILISHSNKKSLMRFVDYMDEKLDFNENNVDKYYINIGDNYYVKNYIGFRNSKDLDKFLNFDFSLHKRLFPNKASGIFACLCLAFYVIIIILSIFCFLITEDKKCLQIFLFFINLIILLGFLIYSIIIDKDVYKNKDLLELKEIKSDDFINGFIMEYISLFNKSILNIFKNIIFLVLLFQIISMIILCVSRQKNNFNYIKE